MLASTAAYAVGHTIHPQGWEENKNGQVYRHCEVKRLTDAAKPFWFPRNIGIAEQEPQAVVPQASPTTQEPPQDIPPTPPVAVPAPLPFNPTPMIEHYPSQFTPKEIEDMNRMSDRPAIRSASRRVATRRACETRLNAGLWRL